MIVHRDNPDPRLIRRAVVTVGSFDGVHAGHRAIIDSLKEQAAACGGQSVIVTLYPHPRKVLGLDTEGFWLLNTLQEKEYLLESCGVDHLVELRFTPAFSRMGSEAFVRDFLCRQMDVKRVVIGYNHHFGHNREGGIDSLMRLRETCGFEVMRIPEQDVAREKVSSTVIREALKRGDMAAAARCLTVPYMFIASVDGRGRVVVSDDMKLIPPDGRYRVLLEDDYRNPSASLSAGLAIDGGIMRLEELPAPVFLNNGHTKISFCDRM